MPIINSSKGLLWKQHRPMQSLLRSVGYILFVFLLYLSLKSISEGTIWAFFFDAPTQVGNMISRMFPPRFDYLATLGRPLWDTLVIATVGTLGSIFVAVPLAFLAAKNTTPHRFLVRPLATLIMVTSRSINSLIWALLLVTILGPGVLAGILAIAFRSVGFIAKLLYEAIEEIDEVQVQAIQATGASPWHVLWFAIVPQITPAFYSVSIYRWDINIRESSVLGYVGAGGIGLYLNSSINSLAWDQVSVILMTILGSVLIAEWITYQARKAII